MFKDKRVKTWCNKGKHLDGESKYSQTCFLSYRIMNKGKEREARCFEKQQSDTYSTLHMRVKEDQVNEGCYKTAEQFHLLWQGITTTLKKKNKRSLNYIFIQF